ncbi:MAG: sugar phosphate isomerase/epimerase, partial [Calditrichia bacterium]|nr:sugar phosphate isomerase/epimerase [Calditrichia bacterium]
FIIIAFVNIISKWKTCMKLGFNVFEKPIEEYFEYATEHGLNHLEIDLIKDHSLITKFTSKRIYSLKKLAKDYKITLSLHTPYTINPADRRSSFRDETTAYLIHCIILAKELNASHITTHIGFFFGMPIIKRIRQKALERLVFSLRQLLMHCEALNIKLALENASPKPLDSVSFFLGDNIYDFKYIFSELDSPYINMCLDIGHANINEGALKYIENFGEKIINLHYHDNRGKIDNHLSIGEGTVPWKEVATALKGIRFKGPFVSECFKTEPHEAAMLLTAYF